MRAGERTLQAEAAERRKPQVGARWASSRADSARVQVQRAEGAKWGEASGSRQGLSLAAWLRLDLVVRGPNEDGWDKVLGAGSVAETGLEAASGGRAAWSMRALHAHRDGLPPAPASLTFLLTRKLAATASPWVKLSMVLASRLR